MIVVTILVVDVRVTVGELVVIVVTKVVVVVVLVFEDTVEVMVSVGE